MRRITLLALAGVLGLAAPADARDFEDVELGIGDAGFLMLALPIDTALHLVDPPPHGRPPMLRCAFGYVDDEGLYHQADRRGGLDCRAREGLRWNRPQTADAISDVLLYTFLTAPLAAPALGQTASGEGWEQGGAEGTVVGAEALAATYLVTGLVKHTVRRVRPSGPETHNAYASFFSGHSSMSFAGATVLTMSAYEYEWGTPTQRAIVPAAAYTLAGFTAYLRVAAERHWLSDVFVGAVVGTGTSLLVYAVR